MGQAVGLACINALGWAWQCYARRFFDALLRDDVNAVFNLNAQKALGPVACTFARQVHPPVHLQQQAPTLLQCPSDRPRNAATKESCNYSAARSDSNGEQRVGRVGPAAAAAASAAAAATATI